MAWVAPDFCRSNEWDEEESPDHDSNQLLLAREEPKDLDRGVRRLALGRKDGGPIGGRREPLSLRQVGGRRPASMPDAPTLASHDLRQDGGGRWGGAAVNQGAMPGTGGTPSVTCTVPPSWCDRRPPESCSSSRTLTSLSSVARRTSAPSSVCTSASTAALRGDLDRLGGTSNRGDVAVCVRLRPGTSQDERCAEPSKDAHAIRLKQLGGRYDSLGEAQYQFDHVFPEEALQEEVFNVAVAPICEGVLSGYNGAVIAYGQTGSGKTHTVVGNTKFRGVAPRAVHRVFEGLAQSSMWSVDVSVLEIYNERARDLLSPGNLTHVEVHEVRSEHEGSLSFRCPDAVRRQAQTPEEALAALAEGMKRRETARTDMNHHSSRSHLIFTLTATQRDPEIGATLRGRLHLVDLAGSERLKRSMSTEFSPRGNLTRRGSASGGLRTPRDQRREAGEINKSLSQLALVIQRLTSQTGASLQLVPYRDSMLTRLLAESFGGSSKTCLIITCSAQASDREETRCSLEFGKRAKLVRNRPQINLEVAHEPSAVVEAFVAKKLEEMQRVQEELLRERQLLQAERSMLQGRIENLEEKLFEAVSDIHAQQNSRVAEVTQLEDQKSEIQERLRAALDLAVCNQEEAAEQVAKLEGDRQGLRQQLHEAFGRHRAFQLEVEEEAQRRCEAEAQLKAMLVERQKQVEEATKQAAELRSTLAELGREKAASLAKLEDEHAQTRAKWLEDVSRLEAEKLAMMAEFQAERVRLQEQQERQRTREHSHMQEAVPISDDTHCEAVDDSLASRTTELRQQLQAVVEDGQKLENLRQARLLCLEAEAQDLQAKWHHPMPPDEESASSEEKERTEVVSHPEEVAVQEVFQSLPSFPTLKLKASSSRGSVTSPSSDQDAPSSPPATRLNGSGSQMLAAWEATKMPPLIPTTAGA